jgi:4-hydroxy-2-oxoheptanedioate aldolase
MIGMADSRLRAILASGRPAWMVNPGGASIDMVDMLGNLGARCLFIDCERTAVNVESVTALARCAQSRGMAALVRTESMQTEIMVRYLDRGIDGIVAPHVETVKDLETIAQVVSYATRGRSSQVFSIAQIESRAAVENIDALAASGGVDAFLIGPNDLAHSMGFNGDVARPEVVRAIDGVVSALQREGRMWGIPASPETAQQMFRRGARLLYCNVEQILHRGYREYVAAAAPA